MQDKAITHKPDFTAWFVLQGTIGAIELLGAADNNKRSLELYRILASEAGKTRFMSRLIHNLPYRLQYKIGELVTNRGRLRHFYLRKKEIEKQARQFLDSGKVEQVIVLGAGLDILALRLAEEYSHTKFIEIDRFESQEFKNAALNNHLVAMPQNLELVSGDLRYPLNDIFATSNSYNKDKKTLWICEGLFMFIPPEDVERIFSQMGEVVIAESYCMFTSLAPKSQGGLLARAVQKLYMRKEKCPYFWAIAAKDIEAFSNKVKWELIEQVNWQKLHQGYINKMPAGSIGDDINIVKYPI